MSQTKEMALEAACKAGTDILDQLMGSETEENSRFEGKAISPSFLVRTPRDPVGVVDIVAGTLATRMTLGCHSNVEPIFNSHVFV